MSTIVLAAQQQDCTTIREKSGAVAYQKCLLTQEESFLKEQIAAYKTLIDRNIESVKARYDAQINRETFRWKDVDLQMQLEEADRKQRIAELGTAKENAEEVQIERNLLARLQKIRSLTTTAYKNAVGKLQNSRKAELDDYSNAVTDYELQLRRQNMPSR